MTDSITIVDRISRLTQKIEEKSDFSHAELKDVQNELNILLKVFEFQLIKAETLKQFQSIVNQVKKFSAKTDLSKTPVMNELLMKLNSQLIIK